MKNLRLLLLGLVLAACAPKVSTKLSSSYSPLDYREDVRVYGLQDAYPASAEEVGLVKITDTGFSVNCGLEQVLEKAKAEARQAGGNALKLVEHLQPNLMTSSCHRITAKILRVSNFDEALVSTASAPEDNSIPDADYALLHVYRASGMGPLVNYDLFLGDSLLCRVKNNWKQTIKVKKDGLNTLWARTERKVEEPIKIELGKEYYVRCGLSMGAFVGHPQITVVDKSTGSLELQSIKEKAAKKK
ncbi:hypothetical protein [Rufibacter psychrotolerans]|uniref:hypothetical protein n=1 Tax=Rufibacter psychrotolerans TaxID=2812556 RepID=UPI001968943A|nr:hypothetical protein [Rufibacter sp. SYSU D00308]